MDGVVCRELGTLVDPDRQRIAVDGKLLENAPSASYILLNKPVGVVTTRSDPQGRRTVLDLLPAAIVDAGVFPVGRLDYDSEGLLILTNDGDWAQVLLHPRREMWKEYRVQTDKPLSLDGKSFLERGVDLDGSRTLPARIVFQHAGASNDAWFSIAIREGRNRQIRRMCKAAGLNVISLQRIKMGPILLGKLPIGDWRELRNDEVEAVRQFKKKNEAIDAAT